MVHDELYRESARERRHWSARLRATFDQNVSLPSAA
jgi:hypothetical protein